MIKQAKSRKPVLSRVKPWVTITVAVPLIVTALAACGPVATQADTQAEALVAATQTPSPSPSPTTQAPVESAEPSPVASEPAPDPSEEFTDKPAPALGAAEAAALALTVKGKSAKTGYDRDEFGSGWVDVDRNGCDTRNDMLILRLEGRDMSGDCKVLAGDLPDPYTGTWIHFERGGASEVDIDHMVALSDAWQKGASSWEFAKRVAFANDPLNLEPVDAGANRQKGDGDAATWLPSYKPFRCEYVARQIAVKDKYEVWVTQPELDAMVRVLSSCPDEPLPTAGDQPVIADNIGEAPTPKSSEKAKDPAPQKTKKPQPAAEVDERFPFCKDLPSGYGPYIKGEDPEYEWYRDGDKDGMVCD